MLLLFVSIPVSSFFDDKLADFSHVKASSSFLGGEEITSEWLVLGGKVEPNRLGLSITLELGSVMAKMLLLVDISMLLPQDRDIGLVAKVERLAGDWPNTVPVWLGVKTEGRV